MYVVRRPCSILLCKDAAKCAANLPTKAPRPVCVQSPSLCSSQATRTQHPPSKQSATRCIYAVKSEAAFTAVAAIPNANTSEASASCSETFSPNGPLGPSSLASSPRTGEDFGEATLSESTGKGLTRGNSTTTSNAFGASGPAERSAAVGAQEAQQEVVAVPITPAAAYEWEAPEWQQRTTLLLGRDGVTALRNTRVLLVGLGGVGSYVAEFLVRAGVGSLAVVDGDVVDITNKNRQLPALDSTIGQPKAHLMSQRLLGINPDLNLVVRQEFVGPDAASERLLEEIAAELECGARAKGLTRGPAAAAASTPTSTPTSGTTDGLEAPTTLGAGRDTATPRSYCSSSSSSSSHRDWSSRGRHRSDGVGKGATSSVHESEGGSGGATSAAPIHWVVDCIDSIAPKLSLVAAATKRGAQVVSSMGAGGRMDPLAVQIADISETYGDPFAATCRRGLRRQYGIRSGVTVVFSTEPCRRTSMVLTLATRYKRSYYGTISFIPALFGLQIAAHIVNDITGGPMMASEVEQRRKLRQMRDVATGLKPATAASGGTGTGTSSGNGKSGRGRTRGASSGAAAKDDGSHSSSGGLAVNSTVAADQSYDLASSSSSSAAVGTGAGAPNRRYGVAEKSVLAGDVLL